MLKITNPFIFFLGSCESLHLMTDYLSNEEKVVMANSKVYSVKAESSRLRKDLIEALY